MTVLAAAAPPSPTLLARLEELNFRVVHVYGLTETYGPITVSPEPDGFAELDAAGRARVLARQGQAYPTADLVRVVDAGDADVPRDGATMGEVVMRGNNVMLGYHDDPEAHGAGLPRRLVPLRRPRRVAPGRHDRAARPRQGRDHLRRREHLDDRGRADARRAPGSARVRRDRDSRTSAGASGRRPSSRCARAPRRRRRS